MRVNIEARIPIVTCDQVEYGNLSPEHFPTVAARWNVSIESPVVAQRDLGPAGSAADTRFQCRGAVRRL